MTTKILQEQNDLTEAQADIDARTIRNVILIKSGLSKNKRRYSEAVLQAAAPVFENSPAFADHPQKPGQARSFRDITGQYVNVRYSEGALRADRVFARTQAGNDALGIAQDVIEGRLSPTIAGLSINAVGSGKATKTEADGDVFEVESISMAQSVDDVAFPAASGSYKESVGDDLLITAIQAMEYLEWFEASSKHIERHAKELKTVRQDDALKAALAEAQTARQALTEAQTQLQAAQQEREAAVLEAATARRELKLVERLKSVNIPDGWMGDLRTKLLALEESAWAAVIESEEKKAKDAGHKIAVSGAGQQVQPTLIVESAKPNAPQPLDMSKFKSPEEFAVYMSQTRITQ